MVVISTEDLVELMASQPLALRKKITGTLGYSFIGDYDAANWVDGTAASRKEAVRKLMKEALASEATEEDVWLRIEGVRLLLMCLADFLKDSEDAFLELTNEQ
ncbi:hypothetical protein [Parasutterella muris]|uniref:Uncharacterized protein n=1 Tax=Parasutterella muris TaxID=2565572 RepID=A0A6L6YDY6_9BURK|nr:hypothetical protein [Parasutterella muris]MVX55624.1 hypothetical protein [Parasutterella muris]